MTSLTSKILFSTLCKVFETVSTSKGAQRTKIFRDFIENLRKKAANLKSQDPQVSISYFPIIRIFLSKLDKERGPNGFKEKALAFLFVRIFCLGKNSADAKKLLNYREPIKSLSSNDFAERCHGILRAKMNVRGSLTVDDIDKFLDKIALQYKNNEKQDNEFIKIVDKCTALELKWLIRIILHDLRLSLGAKTIFDAYHPDAERLYSEKADLRYMCETLADLSVKIDRKISNLSIFSPFKPMLLERLSITEIKKLFVNNSEFIIQTKFDGERSQVHIKDGRFKYYTRHGVDITNNPSYGECRGSRGFLTNKIASLLSPDCRSIILDGEMMGYHKEKKEFSTKGVAFDVKKLTMTSKHQPCLIAFDVLLYNDEILVDKPLDYRLKILEKAFQESPGILLRSKNERVSTVEEILQAFNKSSDNYEEGIVVKRIDGKYKVNTREGSGCYKIKAEYSGDLIRDIDLVIVGGYYGEGRFSGIFSSFLVAAVEQKEGGRRVFYPVTSVGTGLTDEEVRGLNRKFERYWTKTKPDGVEGLRRGAPDVWIKPEDSVVLQIRATEMLQYGYSPANLTLRFPRIEKIREDKPWTDTCTLTELRSLIRRKGVVQKLTKRHATTADLDEVPVKIKKERNSERTVKIDERCFGVNAHDVQVISRLFQGKEICVLMGEIDPRIESQDKVKSKLSKSELETIVLQHSGNVVQNPGKNTFCLIAGIPNSLKARNLTKNMKYDVVKVSWLRRATEDKNLGRIVGFKPWEMVGMKETTAESLQNEFDEYWDSFEQESDKNSVLRSLERIDLLGDDKKIDLANKKHRRKIEELEREMCREVTPDFLMFKNVVGYFVDEDDVTKFAFRFSKGEIKEEIDREVDYVFVGEREANLINLYDEINIKGRWDVTIVKSQWILQCFFEKKLVDKKEFLVG